MLLHVKFYAELEIVEQGPAILMIEAAGSFREGVSVLFTPETPSQVIVDLHGNRCRRLVPPVGTFEVGYHEIVDIPGKPQPLVEDRDPDLAAVPPNVLVYTLPSRYCPSDQFGRLALDMFGTSRRGLQRVQDIVHWINERIVYHAGSSNVSTSARDTVIERQGVCRDFAHLGICFCRALDIPARYVSGYCLDLEPQDLHAYFQAYIDGCWVDCDATSPTPRQAVAEIAIGRDAADCAWWTLFGACIINQMSVNVWESFG